MKYLNKETHGIAHVDESVKDHVVIVGYGRVGRHITNLLEQMSVPQLVVDADAGRMEELSKRGIPGLFGDAANSEVLSHAGLRRARALVVAGPDESASELVVATARDLAPELPIIARASTEDGTERLTQLGAQDVIHPELEGGLELVRHTLLRLGFPAQEITRYTDAVRRDHYDLEINTAEEHRLLHDLVDAVSSIGIEWFRLPALNPLVGKTLQEANVRARTGASVVAILRGHELMANPKSMTIFQEEDRIGLIGDRDEIEAAARLVDERNTGSAPDSGRPHRAGQDNM